MKISVFTPTLNRPQTLLVACTSMLLQSYANWEWVVLDVGDPPAGEGLPLELDSRIRYVHEPPARGPARDFQRALELTSGELVMPLADDDRLMSHALQTIADEIGEHEWLVGTTQLYDERCVMWTTRGGTRESFEQTMAGEYMLGGAVCWRRELSDRLGGFDPAYDGAADFELYTRFGREVEPKIISEVLYCYFDHPRTDSRLNAKRQMRAARRVVSQL